MKFDQLPKIESGDTTEKKEEKKKLGLDSIQIKNDLEIILQTLENAEGEWEDKAYESYKDVVKKIDFKNISQDVWDLCEKILNTFLSTLSEDFDYPIGWNLGTNLTEIINKVVDLNNPEKFIGSLEILNMVEEFYVDFVFDKEKPKGESNRPIQSLIKSLQEKSKDKKSNFLLSSYIEQISKNPNFVPYSQWTAGVLVYIGINKFADISTSKYSHKIKISKEEDYKVIQSLIKERDILEKKRLIIEDTLNDNNNSNLELDRLYINIEEISRKLAFLINKDVNIGDFAKSGFSKEEDKLDKKIFAMIWTNENLRKSIENRIGVNLEKFNLPEQVEIIDYLKNLTIDRVDEIKKFSDKYGYFGFRTFLSIEQGGKEMGDKILALGEKLPEDVAKKIFEKYGKIIDNISKILEFAQHNFTQEINTSPELIKKIEETLYIKGKNILSETYDNLMKEGSIDYSDLEKKLERINADTITTFAIFKQVVKNGEKLPIESIDGSIFSKKKASELSEEQQNEMLELYNDNWKNHPDRDFVESLKDYFKTAFTPTENQEKNYLYTFEKDNKIRAFVRFEEKGNNHLYASALNVDDATKNFGLGEAMMDESLAREAENNILHASCRKDNPSNMRYFEKGFISKEFKKTNDTEEFDLIWDEKNNKNIIAKQKTQEELKNMLGKENQYGIEIRKGKELISLHTEIPKGKALVRCFFDEQNREWYAVYENVKDDYGVNFGETR